jgi:leucyl/phenylalanyl-tRNA--protein transferase
MFPPVEHADEDGLLAIGGDLSSPTLHLAYSRGIFPWPVEELPLLWFAPPQRGVLFCDEFNVSRRLRRTLRSGRFKVCIDTDFGAVMQGCAAPRAGEDGTWITEEILEAYTRLHREGYAHCVATYRDGELVGGLYGVSWGAYFCGESMFHREDDASKAALVYLVEHIQSRGATWIDIQMMTPHFRLFGAREVPRAEFTQMLQTAIQQPVRLFN